MDSVEILGSLPGIWLDSEVHSATNFPTVDFVDRKWWSIRVISEQFLSGSGRA